MAPQEQDPLEDTWLHPKVVQLAQAVARDGLRFSLDKEDLKLICQRLAGPARPGEDKQRVYERILDGLMECDRVAVWRTAKTHPGETDEAQQIREYQQYQMLATMFLRNRDGVRVGLLTGR